MGAVEILFINIIIICLWWGPDRPAGCSQRDNMLPFVTPCKQHPVCIPRLQRGAPHRLSAKRQHASLPRLQCGAPPPPAGCCPGHRRRTPTPPARTQGAPWPASAGTCGAGPGIAPRGRPSSLHHCGRSAPGLARSGKTWRWQANEPHTHSKEHA